MNLVIRACVGRERNTSLKVAVAIIYGTVYSSNLPSRNFDENSIERSASYAFRISGFVDATSSYVCSVDFRN